MRAGALRAADDGAEIVRVADLVTHDHEGRFSALLREGENIVDAAGIPHGADRDHALVGVGAAHEIQLAAIAFHHDQPQLPRPGSDMPQGLVHVAAGDHDLVDRAPRAQSLDDGVAPLDQLVFHR